MTHKKDSRNAFDKSKISKAKILRDLLIQQMSHEYSLDFITYYLTETQLDLGTDQAPIVTVVTAWDKDSEDCDNKYMRGVAICSQKESPSRLEGFNKAARRLLRVVKDGLAPIRLDPHNERLWNIWNRLGVLGLVTTALSDGWLLPFASSYAPVMTPLEICVLESRTQRRTQRQEDRKKRHEERDKFFLIVKQSEGLHSKGDE